MFAATSNHCHRGLARRTIIGSDRLGSILAGRYSRCERKSGNRAGRQDCDQKPCFVDCLYRARGLDQRVKHRQRQTRQTDEH